MIDTRMQECMSQEFAVFRFGIQIALHEVSVAIADLECQLPELLTKGEVSNDDR